MNRAQSWGLYPWGNRFFLFLPTMIFTIVAKRYLLDPVHAAVPVGVTLATPEAMTELRIIGAVVLAFVLSLWTCVFSKDRLREGHAMAMLLTGTVLIVRFIGFGVDGTTLAMGRQTLYVVMGSLFLVLNTVGYLAETKRRSA